MWQRIKSEEERANNKSKNMPMRGFFQLHSGNMLIGTLERVVPPRTPGGQGFAIIRDASACGGARINLAPTDPDKSGSGVSAQGDYIGVRIVGALRCLETLPIGKLVKIEHRGMREKNYKHEGVELSSMAHDIDVFVEGS